MVMMVAVNECCGWNAEGQLGRAVVALECRLHGSFCSMTRLSFIRGQTEEEEERLKGSGRDLLQCLYYIQY